MVSTSLSVPSLLRRRPCLIRSVDWSTMRCKDAIDRARWAVVQLVRSRVKSSTRKHTEGIRGCS